MVKKKILSRQRKNFKDARENTNTVISMYNIQKRELLEKHLKLIKDSDFLK